MFIGHVYIQVILGIKTFATHFTMINKGVLEVNTLYVLPEVPSIIAFFTTQRADVRLGSTACIFHNEPIKGKGFS